jgi:hypothetical protein
VKISYRSKRYSICYNLITIEISQFLFRTFLIVLLQILLDVIYGNRYFKLINPCPIVLIFAVPVLLEYLYFTSRDLKNLKAIILISSDIDISSEFKISLSTKLFFIIHIPDWESFIFLEYNSCVTRQYFITDYMAEGHCTVFYFEHLIIVIKSKYFSLCCYIYSGISSAEFVLPSASSVTIMSPLAMVRPVL